MRWMFAVLIVAALSGQATAQEAFSSYLSGLPAATAPLTGAELVYVLQGGQPRRATAAEFTAGLTGIGTVGHLTIVGPLNNQVQDSAAAALSPGYVTLPTGLNITKTINFGSGAGTADGPANQIIYAPYTQNLATGVCALSAGQVCHFSQVGYVDRVDASANSNGMWNFEWDNVIQSPGKGSRATGTFTFWYQGSADTNGFYAALQSQTKASANAGGTSGAGNGKGDLFGFNPTCTLGSGAIYWSQCVGIEIDVSIQTGASVDQTIGEQIVQDVNYLVSGNQVDIAWTANNQLAKGTARGWDILLADGAYAGYPGLKTTGSVFSCYPHANNNSVNPCGTIGYGIDFNNYSAITNYIIRGPSSNGYIDGSFNISAHGLALPAITTGTPVASVCIDAGNNIIKKTTTGSCI